MEKTTPYKTSERLIPESQLREAVRQIIQDYFSEMLGINNSTQRQWHDTELAYSLLGLNSSEQLRAMVRDGTLRIGVEVRDVRSPNSQIPRYQFHIEKCEARLIIPPEKRRTKKIA